MSNRSIVRLFLFQIALLSVSTHHIVTAQQTTRENETKSDNAAPRFNLLSNHEGWTSIGRRVLWTGSSGATWAEMSMPSGNDTHAVREATS